MTIAPSFHAADFSRAPHPSRAALQSAFTSPPAMAAQAAEAAPEINAWVVVRPDDTRRDPGRPRRDGTGHADRTRPARCRGTRLRLVEGHDGVPDTGPERRAQPRLGQFPDRRQPGHPRIAGLCAQRCGAAARHDAGSGCRQRMEGAGLRMHGGKGRDHAHAVRPHDDLRQGRRGRRQARAARKTSRSRIRRTGRSPASR